MGSAPNPLRRRRDYVDLIRQLLGPKGNNLLALDVGVLKRLSDAGLRKSPNALACRQPAGIAAGRARST